MFVVALKNHFHVHLMSHICLRGPVGILQDSEVTYLREAQQANTDKTADVWATLVADLLTLCVTCLWFDSLFTWWFSGMVLWNEQFWVILGS